jgi:hypothetical protein
MTVINLLPPKGLADQCKLKNPTLLYTTSGELRRAAPFQTHHGVSLGPNFPAINIPNVKIVRTVNASVMRTVTIRATGKLPLVSAAWTTKYRVMPVS